MRVSVIDNIRRWPRLSALLVAGALVCAVILATLGAAAEQATAGNNAALSAFGPGKLGRTRYALAQAIAGNFAIDERTVAGALRSAPLASDPFAAIAANGLRARQKGSPRETALLDEALRRNPRSRAARILAMRTLVANGKLEPAFDQLAAFNRLNPDLVQTVMGAMTDRIATPRMMDQAIAAIGSHDELYVSFVDTMARRPRSPAVVVRMAERLPASVLANREVRASVVQQLVSVNELRRARSLWQAGTRNNGTGLVHAPEFTDRSSAPPFNWELMSGSTGVAEPNAGGGLSIVYFDRSPGYLVRQLLTLESGNYRILARFEKVSGNGDNVRVQLKCVEADKVLAEFALVASKPGLNELQFSASVPGEGCSGQYLAVVGAASDQRGETQVVLRKLDVVRGTAK